ncbi:MAG: ATP-dependent DNA helicase RecG [Gemmatimonadetes bacterium]|nr:ATP-dependent DNA helicase RecG [Gemmatimonadota bacterium]
MSARDARPGGKGRITLDMPIQFLKGVGERRADLLKRLNIRTAGDLLYHIPHRYEDASTVTPIVEVSPGQDVVILGRVISKGVLPTRKGLRIFQAVVQDASGMIEVSWPGQAFLDRSINKGDLLLLSGPCKFYHGRQLQPREYVNLGGEGGAEDTDNASGKVLSVYAVTEGLTVRQMRAIIEQHLDALLGIVEDYIPGDVKRPAGSPALADALRAVHRPTSLDEARRARNRLAFDELFCVHVLHRRANAIARNPRAGHAFEVKGTLTRQLADHLPYQLTGAQKRVIREITADMASPRRMHRLLQGDVGSGKTIVGVFAAMLAMENGFQVAVMAPTELLAEQHARSMGALLAPLGIEPVLVLGALGAAARRAVDDRLRSVDPLLAVGTHALVTERTAFGRLGLAIIDEQHRFGVEQRAALSAKGDAPDVLLMSATPIPRSLALTMYGDLDVSTLDERPPGRQPITTAVRPESAREKVMSFVVSQVKQGRQAYIVYPVIEDSEKTDLKAATTMFAQLGGEGGALHGLRVALLHGRLPGAERDDVMRRFRGGEVDVLVATTVIEVGIDVPNATVMIVEHPERFGLSQLHQLRGRVGRGAEESFCILLGGVGADAYQRLKLFASTEDGFELARADLRLRGMGDLLGAQQSGVATFRIADPVEDEELGLAAREAATALMDRDPTLGAPEHRMLRDALGRRFPRALELFRVG